MDLTRLKARIDGRKRINKLTDKPYKYGDKPTIDDLPHKDGKVFIRYMKDVIKTDGYYVEKWQTPLTKEQHKIKNKAHAARHKPTKDNPGKRELNLETGEYWKRGEKCPERGYFFHYVTSYVKNDGYFRTIFYKTYDEYHRKRIENILTNKPKQCEKENVDFDLDLDYLVQIFPDDSKCPALGCQMKWQSEPHHPSSPSLDRITPSKGYIKGNVAWISNRANTMKHNASLKEFQSVCRWYEEVDNEDN